MLFAPAGLCADTSEIDRDRALKLLRSLRDGVMMTDTMLMKVGGWGWGWVVVVGGEAGRHQGRLLAPTKHMPCAPALLFGAPYTRLSLYTQLSL